MLADSQYMGADSQYMGVVHGCSTSSASTHDITLTLESVGTP